MRILEKVPSELKEPLAELANAIEDRLRSELSATRPDLGHLDNIVAELAQDQKETRAELKEIATVVRSLAHAQKRTDESVAELAQA
jgi:ABC-type transporter Mla subunit MlaD